MITIEIPSSSTDNNLNCIQLRTIKVGVPSEEIIAQIEEDNDKIRLQNKERFMNHSRKESFNSIQYPREQLKLINKIDEGNFGQVWKGIIHQQINCGNNLDNGDGRDGKIRKKVAKSGKIVAVKTNKLNSTESDQIELLNELDIMTKLSHNDNVVKLIAACTETG